MAVFRVGECFIHVHATIAVMVLSSGLAGSTATAQEAVQRPSQEELAVLANFVHQTHCADMQMGDVQVAAQGYQEVGRIWEQLDAAYSEGEEAYLLYWRGILAECLGQTEQAVEDLTTFTTAYADSLGLALMVKDAHKRVLRIRSGDTRIQENAFQRKMRIAFPQDEEARSVLSRPAYHAYLRSGLTLSGWLKRRFSLTGTVVVVISGGYQRGPRAARHYQLFIREEVDVVFVGNVLVASDRGRIGAGLEGWPRGAVCFGGQFAVTPSSLEYVLHNAQSPTSADWDDASSDESNWNYAAWLEAAAWMGVTPLPNRRFKPLVRAAFLLQIQPGQAIPGAEYRSRTWIVPSIGGFLGVVIQSQMSIGVEIGSWVFYDLTENVTVNSGMEEPPADLLTPLTAPPRWSINPTLGLRLTL
jgi:hypothetical protein